MKMARYFDIILVIFSFIFISSCSDDNGTNPVDDSSVLLEQVKDSLSKYQDVSIALQDGYVGDLVYVYDPDTGAGMGFHFVNFGITGVDPFKPQILLYSVTDSGKYELIGLEWFVLSEAVSEAPVLFDHTFDGPMEGHGPDQPEHYDLHVWLFKENPDGMFEEFNTDVTPPSFIDDFVSAHLAITTTYSDVQAALDAGYINTEECVSSPDGGMGIHFVNTTIEGIDPLTPQILLYEPQGDGSYKLIGAEWFVPSAAVSEAPVLFGQTFNGPMAGHGPDDPEHYDLHVWLAETNPSGIFAEFNPNVSCPE